MANVRACLECTIKLCAFMGALMSVAVLCFSTVVLIASINHTKGMNKTDSRENPSDTVVPSDNSSFTYSLKENATDQAYPPLRNSSLTPVTSETTLTSLPGVEIEEKNVSASTPPPTTPSSISPVSNVSVFTSVEQSDNDTLNNSSTFLMSTSMRLSSNEAEAKPWQDFFERQHDLWKDKTDTYIILMQASSGTGIFAAILQLFFSLLLICGSQKDLRDRTSLWNLSNFIVFILSILIILLPFSYNNTADAFKRGSIFWRDLSGIMMDFPKLFSSRTMEVIWNNAANFLTENFVLYYYIMGTNSFILLVFLMPPIIWCLSYPCRRYCCRSKYDLENTESDLMLFETGGDPFNRYS